MFKDKIAKAKIAAKKLMLVALGAVIGISWFYDVQMYLEIVNDLK